MRIFTNNPLANGNLLPLSQLVWECLVEHLGGSQEAMSRGNRAGMLTS